MRTVLYARVSTADQKIEHQRTQAEALGFQFDEVIFDEGVSGVSTKLREREGGKRLFDLLREGDTLVVRWVDRLGRNYEDVSDNMKEFMRRGIIVKTIINGMTFDGATKDPIQKAVRDALIGFMAATAQAQAEATKEAQKAGIAHAKANCERAYKGRKPSYTAGDVTRVSQLLSEGKNITEIAQDVGISRQTVYRIQTDPAEAIAIATAWEPA